jgi:hypothetical protein
MDDTVRVTTRSRTAARSTSENIQLNFKNAALTGGTNVDNSQRGADLEPQPGHAQRASRISE